MSESESLETQKTFYPEIFFKKNTDTSINGNFAESGMMREEGRRRERTKREVGRRGA